MGVDMKEILIRLSLMYCCIFIVLYTTACSSGGKFVVGWLPVTEIDERQTLTQETKPKR